MAVVAAAVEELDLMASVAEDEQSRGHLGHPVTTLSASLMRDISVVLASNRENLFYSTVVKCNHIPCVF